MGKKKSSYFYCVFTCLLETVNYFQISIDYIYSSRHCLFISFVDFFLIGLFVFLLLVYKCSMSKREKNSVIRDPR